MKTPEHMADRKGSCLRCGLSAAHGAFCPPGFWMTKAEIATWEQVGEGDGRRAVEKRALAVRGRAGQFTRKAGEP